MILKIEVDEEECDGEACGLCYNEACPEIFEKDMMGIARIREEYRLGEPSEGKVPSDLKECVQRSVDICPNNAIVMLEVDENAKDKVVGY